MARPYGAWACPCASMFVCVRIQFAGGCCRHRALLRRKTPERLLLGLDRDSNNAVRRAACYIETVWPCGDAIACVSVNLQIMMVPLHVYIHVLSIFFQNDTWGRNFGFAIYVGSFKQINLNADGSVTTQQMETQLCKL